MHEAGIRYYEGKPERYYHLSKGHYSDDCVICGCKSAVAVLEENLGADRKKLGLSAPFTPQAKASGFSRES